MNKSELIEAVASDTGHPKTVVTRILEAAHDTTVAALRRGDEVRVHGFGIYAVKQRGARSARNPRTGETIKVAASKAVRFKPARTVVEAVNRR